MQSRKPYFFLASRKPADSARVIGPFGIRLAERSADGIVLPGEQGMQEAETGPITPSCFLSVVRRVPLPEGDLLPMRVAERLRGRSACSGVHWQKGNTRWATQIKSGWRVRS
jgi:hypothetical protein